jgi:hypothetical protein
MACDGEEDLMRFKSRRLLLAVPAAMVALAALAVSPAAAGGQAGYGCPVGFDLGGLTQEQGLALPRVQAGLEAGVFDVAGLTASFNKVDHNGDGVVCFKDVGALNGGQAIWAFAYNIVDDNASVPSG